ELLMVLGELAALRLQVGEDCRSFQQDPVDSLFLVVQLLRLKLETRFPAVRFIKRVPERLCCRTSPILYRSRPPLECGFLRLGILNALAETGRCVDGSTLEIA